MVFENAMVKAAHGCQVVGGLRLRPLAVGVVLAAIEVAPAALVLWVPVVVIVVVVCRGRDACQSLLQNRGLTRQYDSLS